MSKLSREIARWIQTSPGALSGPDAENVHLQAKLKFIMERRYREEFDLNTFVQHLNSLGYRIESRNRHSEGKVEGYFMLALPAGHRGF